MRLDVQPTLHAVLIDENRFVDWLLDAEPGDSIAYYRGSLAHDRLPSTGVLAPNERAFLQAIAHRAFVAQQQGLVSLFQKRLGLNDFLYVAVRARQSKPAVSMASSFQRFSPVAVVPSVSDWPVYAAAA